MKTFKTIFYLLIPVLFTSCGYNSLVTKDEACTAQWAQVENVYKRRADLIPNIVETVKGEASFEQETLTKVVEARASATQVKIDPSNMTEEDLKRFDEAQNTLGGALSRLLMVTENYPNLKANQAFKDLRVELEGSENRISVERKKFIEAVLTAESSHTILLPVCLDLRKNQHFRLLQVLIKLQKLILAAKNSIAISISVIS